MQPHHLSIEADVLIPDIGHASFDCDAFTTFVRQNLLAIFFRLAIETFEARHRDNARAVAELFAPRQARAAIRSRKT